MTGDVGVGCSPPANCAARVPGLPAPDESADRHFTQPPDPQALAQMAARYQCDQDFDNTFPIIQRHGLVF